MNVKSKEKQSIFYEYFPDWCDQAQSYEHWYRRYLSKSLRQVSGTAKQIFEKCALWDWGVFK
jgi:hypothetical protein